MQINPVAVPGVLIVLGSCAGPTVEVDPELAWCPEKAISIVRPDDRLRIATWNMANLHAVDGQSVFDDSERRTAVDYERIRCYVRLFDPDVLAVQEVDGDEALSRIVDLDVYEVVTSGRPSTGFGGRQNTGFAYKRALDVTTQPAFEDLDINGRNRYGTRIDVSFGGETLRMMSVHLKSGCFENGNTGDACDDLFLQVPILEGWIDEAAAGPDPFVILGDFNRRFNQPGDVVWVELDDADPPNADLTAITDGHPTDCRDNRFTEYIDHIVFDARSIASVDRSSFRHVNYRPEDMDVWDVLSDHCPVVVELFEE